MADPSSPMLPAARGAVHVLALLHEHKQFSGCLVLTCAYHDPPDLGGVHPVRVEHRIDEQPLSRERPGCVLSHLAAPLHLRVVVGCAPRRTGGIA